jgi:hypothetical protein
MPSALLTLNTVLLVYQPSNIKVKPPKGSEDEMEEGNWQGSSNNYGWEITCEWGPRLVLPEALAELRTRRGGLDEVRVQLTDMNSVALDKTCLWLSDPEFSMTNWGAYDSFTITWREVG